MAEFIGWASSVVLILAISAQVYKEWKAKRTSVGSVWLYVGQMIAELGFVAYSLMLDNLVFAVTNGFLFFLGLLGLIFWMRSPADAEAKPVRGSPR